MSRKEYSFIEVCDIQGGTQPPKDEFVYDKKDGYIRLLQIQDFKREDKAVYIKDRHTLKKCNSDDILIGRYGASIGKIFSGLSGAYNVALVKTIPDLKKINKRFLWHFLNSVVFQEFIKNVSTRAAQAGFNKDDLAKLKIYLPSLNEQVKLASVLDVSDAIRKKREQTIKLADDFLCATFLEMFGDPVENPKGWKKDKIKKGVLGIASGWSATGENIPCKSDEFGVLKISSVTSGVFKPEENKVVACESIPASKKLIHPKKGDLLFSRANTRELVAAICMVHQDYVNLFLPDKLWSIKLNHKLLLPEFFLILIQNEKVRELLTKQATGTSGSMLNISKNKFEETEIIFPEINVQKDFCNTFRKTINLKTKLIKSNELANESFNSLSQKVFQQ
ncbi:TPA: restriction endonuclease subunit S [Klebsiella quasipneumoniae subsp. similipneumoniae]|uniref:restriction endonuclease subunit S n=1 Tax=Enterobacteriaceae TaxID=543 RepID=UPI001E657702|nr:MULTISPECIES: restriction endonuclease subunit S [Enterobacteriaceae]UER84417.1 restriction endonuclease subunit S [Enterobacter cloacae]HBQ3154592.1 restriction endonuclease subunit S [Klebsiella quasipneumoniae subsp. similipneumoniae]